MPYLKEVTDKIGICLNTLKGDIDEIFGIENIERSGGSPQGKLILSPEHARTLYSHRGLNFKRTVAIFGNQKGGVGKSLLTTNVAIKAASIGARVLIIDLDPEACATNFLLTDEDFETDMFITMLEIFKEDKKISEGVIRTKYENLDILPCKGKARRAERYVRDEHLGTLMKRKMEGLEHYDLILFEVPPTYSPIIESCYIAADKVFIPTFPDKWSIESCILTEEDIKDSCEKWQLPVPEINILLNKYSQHRNASKDAWSELLTIFGNKVLPLKIKDTTELQNSTNNGISIFDKKSRASKGLKDDFTELVQLVCPLVKEEVGTIQ